MDYFLSKIINRPKNIIENMETIVTDCSAQNSILESGVVVEEEVNYNYY